MGWRGVAWIFLFFFGFLLPCFDADPKPPTTKFSLKDENPELWEKIKDFKRKRMNEEQIKWSGIEDRPDRNSTVKNVILVICIILFIILCILAIYTMSEICLK